MASSKNVADRNAVHVPLKGGISKLIKFGTNALCDLEDMTGLQAMVLIQAFARASQASGEARAKILEGLCRHPRHGRRHGAQRGRRRPRPGAVR
jgi:hypothetical protein